jgi:5-methylcytosine-specific restriction endonuclease McrA
MTSHYYKYKQYLKSIEWKAIRLDIIQLRQSCERCGSIKRLEVHHKTYARLFNEKLSDLELLCSTCHRKEHNIKSNKKKRRKNRFKKRKVLAKRNERHDYSISDTTMVKRKGKRNYSPVKMPSEERQRILDLLNKQ